jgi:glycerol-3-phosphate acyltransferase PlsY
MPIQELLLVTAAYLLGSVASAIVVCKLMRLPDPREVGSRNPGATNVLRAGGKLAALLTLLGDLLKGLIPVAIAVGLDTSEPWLGAVGLAAFLGHLYPLYFGFRGGKGVATGFGVLLGLNWQLGVITLATWLVVAALTRYSSLAALVAFAFAPGYTYWLTASGWLSTTMGLITLLVFWRHRSNIRNLLGGTEGRIGAR